MVEKNTIFSKIINAKIELIIALKRALSSLNGREQFVKQLETILDGIKNNLGKVCKTILDLQII